MIKRERYPALHSGVRFVLLLLLGKSANAIWMGVSRREPQDLLGPNRDVRFLHRLFRYWCDLAQLFQITVLNGSETGTPLLC